MRAGRLLSGWAAGGEPVDRTGKGKWIEVYPVAALRRWGLSPAGYKAPGAGARRRELLNELENRAGGWLRLSAEARAACEVSDHAFDALVAALIARAAALGLCEPVPAGMTAVVEKEGWIALPRIGSLQALV